MIEEMKLTKCVHAYTFRLSYSDSYLNSDTEFSSS